LPKHAQGTAKRQLPHIRPLLCPWF